MADLAAESALCQYTVSRSRSRTTFVEQRHHPDVAPIPSTTYATSQFMQHPCGGAAKACGFKCPLWIFFFLGKSSSRFCGCSFTARSWLRTRWTHFSAGGLHARRALAEVHSQINKHEGCHSDTPNQLHFVLLLSFFFSIDVYIDLFVASH